MGSVTVCCRHASWLTAVGIVLGMAVGIALGTAVGVALGTAVGVALRMAVGVALRTAVGIALGTDVGIALGVCYLCAGTVLCAFVCLRQGFFARGDLDGSVP